MNDDRLRHVIVLGGGSAGWLTAGLLAAEHPELHITLIEGPQCVDFNCFNLHDYKEFMHCGRTRTVHGFHPSKGSVP